MAHWYALRSAVRSERTALRELQLARFEVYLPEYKIERFNRRKRISIVSTLALFPGYLFVKMERDQFRAAKSCKGVVDLLPGYPHEPRPMPANDVLELRAAQEAMLLDDTDEARRHRGETVKNTLAGMRKRLRNKQVRVGLGSVFEGLVGTVQKVHSIERLRLLINGLAVDIDADQVEEMAA